MSIAGNKAGFLKSYMLIAFVGGLAVLVSLFLIPSDSKNALFLGFSGSRLALIGLVLAALLASGGGYLWVVFSLSAIQRTIGVIDRFLSNGRGRAALIVSMVTLAVVSTLSLLVPAQGWGDAAAQFERVAPVIAWMSFLALQTLIVQFLWSNGKFYWQNLTPWRHTLLITLMAGSVLAAVAALVIWSRIGIQPDRSGWYPPGTPILFAQLLLAWGIGTLLIVSGDGITQRLSAFSPRLRLDFLVGVGLWLAAGLVWAREPLQRFSYYAPEPTPPNFEYYPYSDARLYDEASQNILIGTARNLSLFLRPLYTFFLALLHFIGGQNFERLLLLQIAVLAVIPVLIYVLASMLGNRPAGLIAALLAIFRERNSIALTNVIEVSHSKLLLSDVPALALMLLFILILVKWLKKSRPKNHLGIIAGASLGLVILARSQAQLLIPVVLIGIIFNLHFQWRSIARNLSLFLVGLLVVLVPWLWRNYQDYGRVAVENSSDYIGFFASSYHTDEQSINALSGETGPEYERRMKQQAIDFIVRYPGEVARFWTSHFVHNEIHSIIYLPMSLKLYDLRSYVKEMGYWSTLQTDLSFGSAILFFLSLGLIAFGVGAAVKRLGLLGLAPLVIHLAYSLTIVPARLSGWRFILPVDWVSVMYYSIGLAQVTAMGLAALSKRYAGSGSEDGTADRDEERASLQTSDRRKTIPVLAAFLILGLSLPIAIRYIPERYPALSAAEIIQKFAPDGIVLNDGTTLNMDQVLAFAETERAVVTYGRALYPSFYEAGEYWGDLNFFNLDVRDTTRVQFDLTGPSPREAFLPISSPPAVFPHASDVMLVGCITESGYTTRALIVIVDEKTVLSASPWPGLTCAESK